jgi:PAS domain S-box-containing protein
MTSAPSIATSWLQRGRTRERELTTRVAELEARVAEQTAQLERSEAARFAAESELRAVEVREALQTQGHLDALWVWDLTHDTVQLSPRWLGMIGCELGAVGPTTADWWSRVHADDRESYAALLQRCRNGELARFEHEVRLLHRDGGVRHVLSRGAAVCTEAGTAYRIIGLDTDVTRLKRMQCVLDAVIDGTAGTSGEGFFASLVRHFAKALDVERVFLAECADDPPTRVRTLAFWTEGEGLRDSFEFALAGTPCEEVVRDGRVCAYPQGVGQRFPREAGWESYLGLPIIGSDGKVLGHLAFFGRQRARDEAMAERVSRVFLARAAAEIERRRALDRLAELRPPV